VALERDRGLGLTPGGGKKNLVEPKRTREGRRSLLPKRGSAGRHRQEGGAKILLPLEGRGGSHFHRRGKKEKEDNTAILKKGKKKPRPTVRIAASGGRGKK